MTLYHSHPLVVETVMALMVQVNLTDSPKKDCCGGYKYQGIVDQVSLQGTLATRHCTGPWWNCKISKVVFKLQKDFCDVKFHKKTHCENCPQDYRVHKELVQPQSQTRIVFLTFSLWKLTCSLCHLFAPAVIAWCSPVGPLTPEKDPPFLGWFPLLPVSWLRQKEQ